MPHTRAFKVVGIFSLGLFEFDSEYALVDLPVAERVFGKDQPQFMQLRLDDMFASRQVAAEIPRRLGEEYAKHNFDYVLYKAPQLFRTDGGKSIANTSDHDALVQFHRQWYGEDSIAQPLQNGVLMNDAPPSR